MPNGVANKTNAPMGNIIVVKALDKTQAALSIQFIHIVTTTSTFLNSHTGYETKIVEDKFISKLGLLSLILRSTKSGKKLKFHLLAQRGREISSISKFLIVHIYKYHLNLSFLTK